MIQEKLREWGEQMGIPRESGDDPDSISLIWLPEVYSPRERG